MMIDENLDKIKLIDIGTAEYSKVDENKELAAAGSPFFMSPEVFEQYLKEIGEIKTTKASIAIGNYIKSDVYSTTVSII